MGFLTGSIERRVILSIDGQNFAISRSVIEAELPALHAGLELGEPFGGYLDDAVDFAQYRPVHATLFPALSFHVTVAPDEHESRLPHGVYRHWDGTHLALLIANRWGVLGGYGNGTALVPRAMNPFTFNYASPASSPASNAYTYAFAVAPEEYGITGAYKVTRKTFSSQGLPTGSDTVWSQGAGVDFNGQGSLAHAAFQAYYFDPQ